MSHISRKEAWRGIANCSQCSIRNSALFAGLTEEDFLKVHQLIEQFEFKAGNTIYTTGDSARYMYTIRSGMVKLSHFLADGTQRIVRLLHTADVIGMEAILEPAYKHDAIAIQDTEVCRYPVSEAKELSRTNPVLFEEFMKRWQLALNDADTWLTEFSTGNSKQRVARLILKLAKSNADNTCSLFSRDDMGATLGMTTETTSRIIAEFRRQGVIVDKSGNLFQCDLERLEEISQEN